MPDRYFHPAADQPSRNDIADVRNADRSMHAPDLARRIDATIRRRMPEAAEALLERAMIAALNLGHVPDATPSDILTQTTALLVQDCFERLPAEVLAGAVGASAASPPDHAPPPGLDELLVACAMLVHNIHQVDDAVRVRHWADRTGLDRRRLVAAERAVLIALDHSVVGLRPAPRLTGDASPAAGDPATRP